MRLGDFRRNLRKPNDGVFAFENAFNTLHWYRSAAEAITDIQGIEVAEGNWCFYAADGAPLEAIFTTPVRINPEKNTYSNGVYTLAPGSGERLQDVLPSVSGISCEEFRNITEVKEFLAKRRKLAG